MIQQIIRLRADAARRLGHRYPRSEQHEDALELAAFDHDELAAALDQALASDTSLLP